VNGAEVAALGALAVSKWLPTASALVVTLKLPFAAAVAAPTEVVPSRTVTVAPAGAPAPFTTGVVTVDGEAGVVPLMTSVARTTYVTGAEAAAPGAVALSEWLPTASALVVTLKLPSTAAVALPTGVVPSRMVTVAPAGIPAPLTVGVVTADGEVGVVPAMTGAARTT